MRTESHNLFATISNDQMNEMVKEVKETVASDMNQENSRSVFSAAELWRIQKNRKTRVQRRAIF